MIKNMIKLIDILSNSQKKAKLIMDKEINLYY